MLVEKLRISKFVQIHPNSACLTSCSGMFRQFSTSVWKKNFIFHENQWKSSMNSCTTLETSWNMKYSVTICLCMFSLLMSGWQLAKQGAASVYQVWSCLIMSHPDQRNSSTTHDVCKSNQLQIAEMEHFFLILYCSALPSRKPSVKAKGCTRLEES